MHEAKSHLSELVRKAEAGREIVLARDGRPAVRLVPVAIGAKRLLGVWRGAAAAQPRGWDEKIPPETVFPGLFD